MNLPQSLFAVRFTQDALLCPAIGGGNELIVGAEYVVSEMHLAQMEKYAEAESFTLLSTKRNLADASRVWDRTTSLNGKRCLWLASGGAGDALAHTAVVAEMKRRYPKSEWTVLCHTDANLAVWLHNPNTIDRHGHLYPFPAEAYEAFDYHFIPESLIYEKRDEHRSWYHEWYEWAGITDGREEWMRPTWCVMEGEDIQAAYALFSFARWNEFVPKVTKLPDGYAVVQINTSKRSRNVPPAFWIDVIRALMRRFPQKPVVLMGEGDYAFEFLALLKDEVFSVPFVAKDRPMYPPVVTNFVDFRGGDIPFVEYRVRPEGDLGRGSPMRWENKNLGLRGIAPILRNAAVVIGCDSAFSHLAAARGINTPCIALFGAFDPEWRTSTYPRCVSLWKREACKFAPCAFHDEGLPAHCPSKTGWCSAMEAFTATDVMEAIDNLIPKD